MLKAKKQTEAAPTEMKDFDTFVERLSEKLYRTQVLIRELELQVSDLKRDSVLVENEMATRLRVSDKL